MMRRIAALAALLLALAGTALAQDAATVIANARKALGDVTSITYSGTAKDVAFQQCGANATEINRVLFEGRHSVSRRADGGERSAAGTLQLAGDVDQNRSVKPVATVTSFRVFESLPSKGLKRDT